MRYIPYGVMNYLQAEVAKIVAKFPQIKKHRSGGGTGKPGRIWLMVDELALGKGLYGKPAYLAWKALKVELMAAMEILAATFATLKIPGERVPRCDWTVEVDALADAIPMYEEDAK